MKPFLNKIWPAFLGLLAPAKMLIGSVTFLIMADLLTGIWAALKRKEAIKSAFMRRTVSKFIIYNLAIISAYVVEHYLLDHAVPVSKLVASVIGLVELKSILENSNTILGQNLFKLIIAKLGSDNDIIKQELEKK